MVKNSTDIPFETHVAILGPGLLGGSMALALRARWPQMKVSIWARRPTAVDEVLRAGIAHHASTVLADVVTDASLIVLATPVESMAHLAEQLVRLRLSRNVLVSDVGSVKGSVVNNLEPLLAGIGSGFIGSHPMAGSEKSGIDAARADLFHGAACVITPTEATDLHGVERLHHLWQGVGCRTIELSPLDHDRYVARISHLPHLSAALVTLTALADDVGPLVCAGSGFRDTTRVASGDPDLWTGIVNHNREPILEAIRAAALRWGELLEIVESMDDDRLRRFLAEAKQLRDLLPTPLSPTYGHPES